MEWKDEILGEYCDAQNGYAFKSKQFKSNGGLKVIKIKELKDGNVIFTEDSASVDYKDEYIKYLSKRNDILFALTGDPINKPNPYSWVGRVSRYNYDAPALINQRVCKLLFSEKIDSNFIYYYFRQFEVFKELAGKAKGSASQANISTKDILETKISIPSLPDQRKISSILSSLDSKIETNNKLNAKLEELAQTIFKSWFVDFEPFKDQKMVESELGLIPEGWKVGKLGQLCNFVRGKSLQKKDTVEGNVPVIGGGLTPACYHNEAITQAPVVTVSGSGANAGFTKMYHVPVWAADCSWIDITSKNFYFVYTFLSINERLLKHAQTGAAQPHVKPSDIHNFDLVIPTSSQIEKFQEIVKPLFDKIGTNEKESQRLASLRDTLLPKLMSGEINLELEN